VEQIAHAREAIDSGLQTRAGMAVLLGVDGSTLWRAIRTANDMEPTAAQPQIMSWGRHGHH
jgi:hypothetical protein